MPEEKTQRERSTDQESDEVPDSKIHHSTSDELAQIRTDLAATRTLLGADRTLMAWIRTSLSTIGFGFTIYKILQGLQESGAILRRADTPRNAGLILIGIGIVAVGIGLIEYWHTLKELRVLSHVSLGRPIIIMTAVISALGIFLFASVATHWL
jgi:putative membrane protein